MLNQPIRTMMSRESALKVSPDTTVADAAALMADHQAGALMVVSGERLVGIVTERDIVFRVVALARDPEETVLRDVMTSRPFTVPPGKSFGHALLMMQRYHCRHLPVVEGERPVGIISGRMALDPDLEEFVAEGRRREALALEP